MESLISQSRRIKEEADHIYLEMGLKSLLSKYGEVKPVGSYYLDLMLKKDIDISLLNPDMTVEKFFDLGKEASVLLRPQSMHYRDTRIKPIKNRPPEALYWAFVFGDWNIDMWCVAESYYLESVDYMEDIKRRITDDARSRILAIKQEALKSGLYGRRVASGEIYSAVLDNDVHTYEDFCDLLNISQER